MKYKSIRRSTYTKVSRLLTKYADTKLVPNLGRNIIVRPDDIFLVSYPKSGNTWMRFLLSNLFMGNEGITSFSKVNEVIPDIYLSGESILGKLESPRILKSHEFFDPRYTKVVYLVRNPKSVAVSYYYYLRMENWIDLDISFKDFLQMFINGEIDNYGNWAENVGSWLGARENDPNFHLIKYEDLKQDPKKILKGILYFMDVQISDESIERAIENSSFDNMKKIEDADKLNKDVVWGPNRSIHFIRSGQTDEWIQYFDEESEQLFLEKFGDIMEKLGYR